MSGGFLASSNPCFPEFLVCGYICLTHETALQAATGETDPVAVMAKVRSLKDSYGKRGKI
jgi:hypothetical protein